MSTDAPFRHPDGTECLWDNHDQQWCRMHPLYPIRRCDRNHTPIDLEAEVQRLNAEIMAWREATGDPTPAHARATTADLGASLTELARQRDEARGALAKAWDEGAKCAGSYGHEDDWTHDMHPFDDNPYRTTPTTTEEPS